MKKTKNLSILRKVIILVNQNRMLVNTINHLRSKSIIKSQFLMRKKSNNKKRGTLKMINQNLHIHLKRYQMKN
jgi:hypothetical protein